jgi:hypothetical protein
MKNDFQNMGVFGVFFASLRLSFGNIGAFMQILSAPVLIMIAGLLLCFLPVFTLQNLAAANIAAYMGLVLGGLCLGLLAFCWAFWQVIIAWAASIKIADSIVTKGNVGDPKGFVYDTRSRGGPLMLLLLFIILVQLAIGIIGSAFDAVIPLSSLTVSLFLSVFIFLSLASFVLNGYAPAARAMLEGFVFVKRRYFGTVLLQLLEWILMTIAMLPVTIITLGLMAAGLMAALAAVGASVSAEILSDPAAINSLIASIAENSDVMQDLMYSVMLAFIVSLVLSKLVWMIFVPFQSVARVIWYKKIEGSFEELEHHEQM